MLFISDMIRKNFNKSLSTEVHLKISETVFNTKGAETWIRDFFLSFYSFIRAEN